MVRRLGVQIASFAPFGKAEVGDCVLEAIIFRIHVMTFTTYNIRASMKASDVLHLEQEGYLQTEN
jgi:hypothetical protein